jgi:predicted ferric reductase
VEGYSAQSRAGRAQSDRQWTGRPRGGPTYPYDDRDRYGEPAEQQGQYRDERYGGEPLGRHSAPPAEPRRGPTERYGTPYGDDDRGGYGEPTRYPQPPRPPRYSGPRHNAEPPDYGEPPRYTEPRSPEPPRYSGYSDAPRSPEPPRYAEPRRAQPGTGREGWGRGASREGWGRATGRHTGEQPAVDRHTGQQPAVDRWSDARHTGQQPAVGGWSDARHTGQQDAGRQDARYTGQQDAGRQDARYTGQQDARHTGQQPAVGRWPDGRHTGQQAAVTGQQAAYQTATYTSDARYRTDARHTGQQPAVVDRHTGQQPAVDRHTGQQPAVDRQTGQQAAPARRAPQPYRVPRPRDAEAQQRVTYESAAPPSQVGRHAFVTTWLLGLAFPALLWWQHTGPLDGSGAIMGAAGRLTGLVAGYALLTQILLTARLPFLQKIAGADRMQRWHRDIGALVLVSTLAHAILLTESYAVFDQLSLYREFVKLLSSGKDLFNAFLATAILSLLALLSIRGIRRSLPYELWLLLHRSAYVVLFLGYSHQFSLGQEVSLGSGKIYWTVLYLVVVGALVWGRVLSPLLRNARHRLEVAEVVSEGRDSVSIYLTGRDLDRLDARAGQYIRFRFWTGGCWWQTHPFSLSAPPNEHWLRITVKSVGRYTALLRYLLPGTRVWISAPAGEDTADARVADKAILIVAGSGIAPARALLPEMPPGTVLVYRASTPDDLVLRAELEEVARTRGIQLWFVTGSRDEPGPRRLLSPDGLAELAPDIATRDVYLCGPPGFATQMTATLRDIGVPNRQLHVSAFEL